MKRKDVEIVKTVKIVETVKIVQTVEVVKVVETVEVVKAVRTVETVEVVQGRARNNKLIEEFKEAGGNLFLSKAGEGTILINAFEN